MIRITSKLKLALKRALSLQFNEVETDKGKLVFDGETLEVGTEVYVFVEGSEEPVAAEDGEYVAENGDTIVVAEGKVAEIKPKEEEKPAEEETVEEPAAEPEVEVAAEVEEVVEPAADPVDEPETVEEEKPEDKIAALENRVAELTNTLETILNGVKSLEGRMDEVEATVAKVAQEPAAEPVEETPVEEAKMSRLSYLRKK